MVSEQRGDASSEGQAPVSRPGADSTQAPRTYSDRRVLVLAGSFEQARTFARANNWEPSWTYIRGVDSVLGLHDPVVFVVGTHYERRYADAVLDELEMRGATFKNEYGDEIVSPR